LWVAGADERELSLGRCEKTRSVFDRSSEQPDVTNGALGPGAYRVMPKPFEMHDLEALLWWKWSWSGGQM
jgi:hypothetical protein